MRKIIILLGAIFLTSVLGAAHAQTESKILYINSYHKGHHWSDGITLGMESRLLVEDVWLKIHYMDAARNRQPEQIEQAAKEAKKVIEDFQPDVVITSDDIAAKYLIAPFFKNSTIPFVFTGISWDASVYGFPFQNVTGILEVSLFTSLVDLLRNHSKGPRLGLLSVDSLSGHRSLENYTDLLGFEFDSTYFVNSNDEWKSRFKNLQTEVDMMILESPDGVEGWDGKESIQFIRDEALIPIGSTHAWLAPYSMVTLAKIPEEQGWWAANTAVKILEGEKPSNIPITINKDAKLMVNLELAKILGITFSQEIIEIAEIVGR